MDDTGLNGNINGILKTNNSRVIEGDAEYEEYTNTIKSSLDDVDEEKSKNSDRNPWKGKLQTPAFCTYKLGFFHFLFQFYNKKILVI